MYFRIKRFMCAFHRGYGAPGKKRGLIKFGNGFTLRYDGLACHFWHLSDNDMRT